MQDALDAINACFTFHFHALEKEMATHSSVLAWRIPGTGEPEGLPSMGSQKGRKKAKRWKESNEDKIPDSLGTIFFLLSCIISLDHLSQTGLPTPHWCNCIQISSLPDSQTSFPGHGAPDPTPGSLSFPVCIIGLSHLPHRAVVGLNEIRACPGVCSHLPSQPLTSESLLASHTQLPLRSGL